MEIIVCLETLPDPDCVELTDGSFDYDNNSIRLDSYSAFALEAALQLKERYTIPLKAILLDSFERHVVYEEIKALGCDSIDWVKVPFTFDPFKRAELFAEVLHPGKDDIIITGYHCETCCTNSIPMLIALNKSLPYHSEIKSIEIENNKLLLTSFKCEPVKEIAFTSLVISVRSAKKLRYPSLRDRLASCDEYLKPQEKSITSNENAAITHAAELLCKETFTGNSEEKAAALISTMDDQGMFHL